MTPGGGGTGGVRGVAVLAPVRLLPLTKEAAALLGELEGGIGAAGGEWRGRRGGSAAGDAVHDPPVVHHDIKCPAPNVEVSDVTGAGDTFLAALTFEYLKTKDIARAVKFAVKASAVTVQHLGVYAPGLKDIE